MREKFPDVVELGRVISVARGSLPGSRYGAFRLRCPLTSERLLVIASDGADWAECGLPGTPWEHVSVSAANREPTWAEMCWIKGLFWSEEELVIQYHPPASVYVNVHRHVLHLWRPVGVEVPMPPISCV